jgi:hypothetical protein
VWCTTFRYHITIESSTEEAIGKLNLNYTNSHRCPLGKKLLEAIQKKRKRFQIKQCYTLTRPIG